MTLVYNEVDITGLYLDDYLTANGENSIIPFLNEAKTREAAKLKTSFDSLRIELLDKNRKIVNDKKCQKHPRVIAKANEK